MADKHCTGNPRPVKIPTEKWLTIGKLYYYYTPHKDAPPGTPSCSVTVPWIQMRGRWLNEAGFVIGGQGQGARQARAAGVDCRGVRKEKAPWAEGLTGLLQ